MIHLNNGLTLADKELEFSAIRAQGSGGQNVNKVASAIHLRFDIRQSTLPDYLKERLLKLNDQRISGSGIIIIKAQQHRTQEMNRQEAIERLVDLINNTMRTPRKRIATRPGKAAKRKRLDSKTQRGRVKQLRQPPEDF
ncbi:MAG: alternative ribosome rescue aminoacyl-tRNA hydrolase ArfB [Pseudohongiellaceae bacterium]